MCFFVSKTSDISFFNANDHQLNMNFPEIEFMIITEKEFMIIRGSFTAIHIEKE